MAVAQWRKAELRGRHRAAALVWLHGEWGEHLYTHWLPSRTLEVRMARALMDAPVSQGWTFAHPRSRPVVTAARHCRWWIQHGAHDQLGCPRRRLWLYPEEARARWLPMDEAERRLAERIAYLRAKAESGRAKRTAEATYWRAEVRAMRSEGVPPGRIADTLGLSRTTVYRHLQGWSQPS